MQHRKLRPHGCRCKTEPSIESSTAKGNREQEKEVEGHRVASVTTTIYRTIRRSRCIFFKSGS